VTDKSKASVVVLFSGGLDSSIAILMMLKQKIEVRALMFLTHFGCEISDRSSCSQNPYPIAEKFGFQVQLCHLGENFIDVVRNPRFGHGKNMNPCIDCRIMMLQEAKYVMEQTGAVAVVTGEVLGQRPLSQTRDRLNLVERESGLRGKLLRPLSARLLKPTIPESEGIIDRNLLESIAGRGRSRQMQLAEEFGLDDYPNPASGCLLTDPNYSRRLKDLFKHVPQVLPDDVNLLKVGRHFRFSPESKIVVGRNKSDNEAMLKYRNSTSVVLEAKDTGSPITLLIGEASEEAIIAAARATARYCDQKREESVRVTVTHPDREEVIEVAPADDSTLTEIML